MNGEVWKIIESASSKLCRWEFSNYGRVRSVWRRKPKIIYLKLIKWHPRKGKTPRSKFCVELDRRRPVHQLVAGAFLGACPEGLEINHIDGNQLNNRMENLEYITHRENILHAHRTGLIQRERKVHCKLGHLKTARPSGKFTCLICCRAYRKKWAESFPPGEYLKYERRRKGRE